MKERSVVSVLLLSIFTCGIYSIYWWYTTADDLNFSEKSEDSLMNYLLAILLTFITCGIFMIYWQYKFFKKIDALTGKDNFVVNFVLTIFLSPLVGSALAQDNINNYIRNSNQVINN
ncbi:MAG: DUF4234 domain-containing protein [Candidatus Onthovivens sp.]|nr:DUF4234 domain-containing protein [Candidatus Onthovivens sp.]